MDKSEYWKALEEYNYKKVEECKKIKPSLIKTFHKSKTVLNK